MTRCSSVFRGRILHFFSSVGFFSFQSFPLQWHKLPGSSKYLPVSHLSSQGMLSLVTLQPLVLSLVSILLLCPAGVTAPDWPSTCPQGSRRQAPTPLSWNFTLPHLFGGPISSNHLLKVRVLAEFHPMARLFTDPELIC